MRERKKKKRKKESRWRGSISAKLERVVSIGSLSVSYGDKFQLVGTTTMMSNVRAAALSWIGLGYTPAVCNYGVSGALLLVSQLDSHLAEIVTLSGTNSYFFTVVHKDGESATFDLCHPKSHLSLLHSHCCNYFFF